MRRTNVLANLEKAFAALGWEVDDSPCPAIEGTEKEGKATVKKTDEAVVDDVLLSGAAETEHYEIAIYEGLITHAHAMGKSDVLELVKQNLEQEQHTLEEPPRRPRPLRRGAPPPSPTAASRPPCGPIPSSRTADSMHVPAHRLRGRHETGFAARAAGSGRR